MVDELRIKQWIEENHNITVRELLAKTANELGILVSQTAMRRVIKNLKYSYITPRPRHHKQDETSHVELKKNLVQIVKDNPDAEIMLSDEARFGTHSKLGHGWFETGSRTSVKVKIGYKNFYIYGCAAPITGKNFMLLLPKANTACMNIFLSELSKEWGDRKVILVVDSAGWHKSKDLVVPNNIKLVYLPPYSPELNPIERL